MKNLFKNAGIVLSSLLVIFFLGKSRFLPLLLTAFLAAIAGGTAVYLIKGKSGKCPDCPVAEKQIVYIDTCLLTITTDTTSIEHSVREGRKKKDNSSITNEEVVKTIVVNGDTMQIRKYTKFLNTGLMTIWDTVIVQGSKIVDWNRSYKLDSVILKTYIKTVEKIVLQPSVTEKQVLIPVMNTGQYLGLTGQVGYYFNQPVYGIGINYKTDRMTLSFIKGLQNTSDVEMNLSIPLIKIKD